MGEAHVKGVRGSGDFVGDSEAKTWGMVGIEDTQQDGDKSVRLHRQV